jgi:FtsH-binding integral membrane protein
LNTAGAIGLFIVGSFALIIAFLRVPQLEFLIGGTVVALYMVGLFYAWANTIRQTRKMDEKEARERKETAVATGPETTPTTA